MPFITRFISENALALGTLGGLLAIILWVYRPWAKHRYESDGNIPFDEDRNPPGN